MFKKIYTGVAVFLLTSLIGWMSWIGWTQRVRGWIVQTNWWLVGLIIAGVIFLAIIVDLCYNFFVAHRETLSAALLGLWGDVKRSFRFVCNLFSPKKWLRKTSLVVFSILVTLCFAAGTVLTTNQLLLAFDKANNFDVKIREIQNFYSGRVDRLVTETESLKREMADKDDAIAKLRRDVEILKDDQLAYMNSTKLKFSQGDSKNFQSRRFSR